jgi:fructose-specific phosphotransferase system IIC component
MNIAQYAYLIIAVLAVGSALSAFITYFSAAVSAAPGGGQAKSLLHQFLAFLKDHAVTLAVASVAATAVYLVLKYTA